MGLTRASGIRRFSAALGVALAAQGLLGCSLAEDMLGDTRKDAAQSKPELTGDNQPTALELSLMTGRYGVMLEQVRQILGLVPPSPGGLAAADVPSDEPGSIAQRQVHVAAEFIADVGQACGLARLAPDIRDLACKSQAAVTPALRQPAQPDLKALAARDEQLGALVMPWWDKACSSVPKPANGEPACPME